MCGSKERLENEVLMPGLLFYIKSLPVLFGPSREFVIEDWMEVRWLSYISCLSKVWSLGLIVVGPQMWAGQGS